MMLGRILTGSNIIMQECSELQLQLFQHRLQTPWMRNTWTCFPPWLWRQDGSYKEEQNTTLARDQLHHYWCKLFSRIHVYNCCIWWHLGEKCNCTMLHILHRVRETFISRTPSKWTHPVSPLETRKSGSNRMILQRPFYTTMHIEPAFGCALEKSGSMRIESLWSLLH